ncbi:MAG: MFS transporter [Paenibacillus dendritiformis]|uniref:MFS transporter n=1 Tax=uncultured Paenibacillus sp. TaxID=227322 RepID=UPI0025EE2D8B|nr:MFS transporter [uncultured Paenibacillus sp.]MDU5141738.1 MFS transporter [Paenibacillus dendritiformis]
MRITPNESDANNLSGRLDRLPVSSIHRKTLVTLAIIYFFEYADLNTFSFVAPVLKKEWGMSVTEIGWITSSSFLGMFIGSVIGGWFADRYGRKRAIMLMTLFFSVFSMLTAVAWNPVILGIFRFLTGMGVSAALINSSTYISEFFPSVSRGKFQGIALVVGLLGIPVTGWISTLLIGLGPFGWKFVFVWGGMGIAGVWFLRHLHEIPRWHVSRGETEKAEAIVRQVEEQVLREKGELPPVPEPAYRPQAHTAAKGYRELFKGKYRHRTLILAMAWIFQTLGFYGFGSWVPTLLVQNGIMLDKSLLYSTLITIGAPLGALLGAMISDRFERKWNLVASSLFIAITVFFYGMTVNPLFLIAFGFLVNLIERTYSSNLYTYTSEMYPTSIRGSGYGLTYGLGRFSNVLGPMLISLLLLEFGSFSVFAFISLCWVGSAIALSFGPATNRRSLDDFESGEDEIRPFERTRAMTAMAKND